MLRLRNPSVWPRTFYVETPWFGLLFLVVLFVRFPQLIVTPKYLAADTLSSSMVRRKYPDLNLNGLLVIRQIDNTWPGVCARREITPWLSQEMRTWTHSHQTFQQKRSENLGGHSIP